MAETTRRDKLATGIAGFDFIADGGLPRGGTALVSGTAGSAKSVFAAQFLAEGILSGAERGVYVTFEESPEDIRKNMLGFGWDIAAWERGGKWAFVDASPDPSGGAVVVGEFDLGALLARIARAVSSVGATRLAVDALGTLFTQLADSAIMRAELFRILFEVKKLGVTTIVTAERDSDEADAGYGFEEFVADNVIILRNRLEGQRRRRTIEILKFRGTSHRKGEYPFTVSGEGIVVIPLSAMQLDQDSCAERITSGNVELDAMCGGGFFRGSIILVSGATGTGKTLLTLQFIAGGISRGERGILFSFEESPQQLFRNAAAWGIDCAAMERAGLLQVLCAYPESDSLEDHLIGMKRAIVSFAPHRVSVDSLSALERVATPRAFREFAIDLTAFLKGHGTASLVTTTTETLLGGSAVSDPHVATITDALILLRYVESRAEIRRCLAVLKMRGSMHDCGIREFEIDGAGMRLGARFQEAVGFITGTLRP